MRLRLKDLRWRFTVLVKDFWWRYSKNRAAVLGLIIVVTIALMAIVAPLITVYDPLRVGLVPRLKPPSMEYPMGTDDLGRDVLTCVIYGARVSLEVGFTVALGTCVIGLIVGALAGYYGGLIDEVFMRFTEIFQTIPRFFFVLLLVAVWGASTPSIVLALTFFSWPLTARVVRVQAYSLKEKEFVEAARSIGESNLHITFAEIVPNLIPSVIVNTTMTVASAMLMEGSLSFLGLGDPNTKSWGRMLSESLPFLRSAWWMMLFPGLVFLLAVLAFNLVGDGLNDAYNPRIEKL